MVLEPERLNECLMPDTLFNFDCSDTPASATFEHVPTRLLPRCCLPAVGLGNVGSAYKITGPRQSLIRAAVWLGGCSSFTVPQLQAIISALKLPEISSGSGKRGNVVRSDMVQHLVKSLFPEASQEDWDRMIAALKGQAGATWKNDEEAICKMVSELDPENAREFEPLKRHAKQRWEEKQKEATKAETEEEIKKRVETCLHAAEEKLRARNDELLRAAAGPAREVPGHAGEASAPGPARAERSEGPRRTNVTPTEFKEMLPLKGQIPDVYAKHDPAKKFYKVEYHCNLGADYKFWLVI